MRSLELCAAAFLAAVFVALGVRRRTGDIGVVRVADNQVAVVVDRIHGTSRTVERPGYAFFLPLLEKVHLFDRGPRTLRMEGSRPGPGREPQLFARAEDGSSFWWKDVEIQYAIVPAAAAVLLQDAGPDLEAIPKLLGAAARSILTVELGAYSAGEVARGEASQPAARAAVASLNTLLERRGIAVLGISLGKPAFDEAYEEAIRRRAGFAQEAEELEAKLGRLEQERVQQEARVRKQKEVELLKLEGALARDLAAARKEDVRARRESDDAAEAIVGAGRTAKLEKQSQAALVKARHVAAARATYRDVLDIERSGDLSVRTALVRKLAGIAFEIAPFSRDSAPKRVEYETVPERKSKP